MHHITVRLARIAGLAGAAFAATLLAGCSSELASFDDTYVPASAEENFPITVVEKPMRLTVRTGAGGLHPADAGEVARFGQAAARDATAPVTIRYSPKSKSGQQAAGQAVAILSREGVSRHSIRVTPDGEGAYLTLAFLVKTAETKPCGSWTENLRPNQFNDSGTAFGCSVQQNMAAMVANPGDFEQARTMTESRSAAQNPALTRYNNGTWTTPTADSNF